VGIGAKASVARSRVNRVRRAAGVPECSCSPCALIVMAKWDAATCARRRTAAGACWRERYPGWRQAVAMQTGKTQMAIVRRGIVDRLFSIVFNNGSGAAHQCHLAQVFAVAMRGVNA